MMKQLGSYAALLIYFWYDKIHLFSRSATLPLSFFSVYFGVILCYDLTMIEICSKADTIECWL